MDIIAGLKLLQRLALLLIVEPLYCSHYACRCQALEGELYAHPSSSLGVQQYVFRFLHNDSLPVNPIFGCIDHPSDILGSSFLDGPSIAAG
jgi:hypothetical protein